MYLIEFYCRTAPTHTQVSTIQLLPGKAIITHKESTKQSRLILSATKKPASLYSNTVV